MNQRNLVRTILWILFIVSVIVTFVRAVTTDNYMHDKIFNIIALVPTLLLIFLSLSSKKIYNYPVFVLVIMLLSFLVNMGLSSIIELNRAFPVNIYVIVSDIIFGICSAQLLAFFMVMSIRIFFLFPKNNYIKWFGFLTAILILMAHLNIGYYGQMLPLFLNYFVLLVLIITSLALIFLLPNIDLSSWSSYERIVFYRMILFPFAILLAMNIMFFVFPDFIFSTIGGGDNLKPWVL